MGAVGTHFRMSVANFFGRSARDWVTLRLGEALVVMDGRTGEEFDVAGMRRRWGSGHPFSRVRSRFLWAFGPRLGDVEAG